MKRLACLGFCACLACSGIQFGDDGEGHGNSCGYHEEPIADLTLVPEGFSEPPAATLAPAAGSFGGTLTLSSGELVPLTVAFTLDETSVRAIHHVPGISGARCSEPVLEADVDLTIDGGDTLSGVANCEVRWREGVLSIAAPLSREPDVATTLVPGFSRPPLHPPSVITGMSYADGAWRGQWQWAAFVDCTGVAMCSGIEQVPLGIVELSERP